MFCQTPHTSLIIQPNGNVSVCCSAPRSFSLCHIDDVKSLNDVFKNDIVMTSLREEDPLTINYVCKTCLSRENMGQLSRRQRINLPYRDNETRLKYLEFTTSNVCNQQCSTCTSFYSSKWVEPEKELLSDFPGIKNYPIWRMSEDNIQKIIEVVPQLDYIMIKGGEPFADKNNLIIMKEVIEKNPGCTVNIVSNFHHIPSKVVDMCADIPKLKIQASIDGTGKIYEWIRSTDWNKTVDTMENFHQKTGHRIGVSTTISMHNIFNVIDVLKYFNGKPYVDRLAANKIASGPSYISAYSLPEKYIRDAKAIFVNELRCMDVKTPVSRFECMTNLNPKIIQPNIEKPKQWTEYINAQRGFDITDYVPQLKELFYNAKT